MLLRAAWVLAIATSLFAVRPSFAQAPALTRTPILFDTELGSDIGDAFALALILASPELELRGVTTVSGDTQVRALMACRFLTMTGRRHVQVAAGAAHQPKGEIEPTGQYRYYYHPDVLFNRTTRPVKESAVDFMYGKLKADKGKITIVAAGALTNIARLIAEKPDCKPWIRRIIVAHPWVRDVKASQALFTSGVPLVVLGSENPLLLGADGRRRVFAPTTPLSLQVQALHQLAGADDPSLGRALAVAFCVDERFVTLGERHLYIDDAGTLQGGNGKPNARALLGVDGGKLVSWYTERLAGCVSPTKHPVKLVPQGGMPHRVHVAEDYQNDIERFWWMSGIAELKNLPPSSKRACRGSLTHDFDDLLGHTKAMWTAVIFNPVPGPPMGQNTRLTFRYWLKGTDTLRVQIYSLSNGYHRQLYVTGLPQGKWETATVDMTMLRRPDGTGGPLAENERIDDVQFYVEPTAELLIGDFVLYDAAAPAEKRPFPKRIHFAAGFDSGTQGKNWPGTFDIVPDKGFFSRTARSVANADLGHPWIRLGLRGERTLSAAPEISFRYRLTGADSMRVVLVNRTTKANHVATLKNLKNDEWAQATVDFRDNPPRAGDRVDEVQFLLPPGAELLLDDFVLYEPGEKMKN